MKIFNKFKLAYLSKAYTEGIYADTPANRKLGRVGMSYAAYAEKIKNEKEGASKESETKEIKEYISSIRDKEVRQMAEDAVVKMMELGVNIEDLPKIEYKYIKKQKNEGIYPLAGYDTYSNKLLISSRHDFKETADKIYSLGYNIQPNPILHELGHWFIHKNNKNHNLHKHEKVPLLSKDIEEQVSGRATISRGEFEAELIAGILVGKKFKPEIMIQSDLRFNKDDISKKLYKMGLDGNDRIWEGFHKVERFSQDKNN